MSHLLDKNGAKSAKGAKGKRRRSPSRFVPDEIGIITSTPKKATNSTYQFDEDASDETPLKKLKLTRRTAVVHKPSPAIVHPPTTSSQQPAVLDQPIAGGKRSSDRERIKSLETEVASLKDIVGALQIEVRQLAGKPAPSQPGPDGLVALHDQSKTKMISTELHRIRDSSRSASTFVVSMLPYLFAYREIYRRSLRKSTKSGDSKLALDSDKLNDLLKCAEAHKPGYNEVRVRANLSNHLKNLNNLAADIKKGAVLTDELLKSRKLNRDHLKFTGFSSAVKNKFAHLDEEIARSGSESVNWLASLINQHGLNEVEHELDEDNSMNDNAESSQLANHQSDRNSSSNSTNENAQSSQLLNQSDLSKANEGGSSEENARFNLANESRIDSSISMSTNHEIDVILNLNDESAIDSMSQQS